VKSVLLRLTAVALLAQLTGCSHDPVATIRITNDRATKANIQLKDAAANTTNINDVAGGVTTDPRDVAPGPYTVTAVIQDENVSPAITFTAEEGKSYLVVIATGTPPVLQVDDR
jgi:hypothetical protein